MSQTGEIRQVSEAARRVGSVLNDSSRPLKERFRALFTLRNLGGEAAISEIASCFKDESALLKHELAYCLGQMQDVRAVPILTAVLEDINQNSMVRHEAAEALGAIGDQSVRTVLQKYENDPAEEVAETCQIALRRLSWLSDSKGREEGLPSNPYRSVDPAPPSADLDVNSLKKILLDENETLFERYRAMFALRNLGTTESIEALGAGLKAGSALFRHEVAFVFGQMQDARSVPHLRASLRDERENEMVRHEAAEALGAIATDECTSVLRQYLSDPRRVVSESCEVALDMSEYENSTEFQYADSLQKLSERPTKA